MRSMIKVIRCTQRTGVTKHFLFSLKLAPAAHKNILLICVHTSFLWSVAVDPTSFSFVTYWCVWNKDLRGGREKSCDLWCVARVLAALVIPLPDASIETAFFPLSACFWQWSWTWSQPHWEPCHYGPADVYHVGLFFNHDSWKTPNKNTLCSHPITTGLPSKSKIVFSNYQENKQ